MSTRLPESSLAAAPSSLTFVFWNLRRNFPRDHLQALVHDHRPDLLMLVESAPSAQAELPALMGADYRVYSEPRHFHWIVRRPRCRFTKRESHERYSLARLSPAGSQPLLLALVHFPDPRNYGPYDRAGCARDLARAVERLERLAGHSRTVVVGDFNMDPFAEGMVAADAFHAMMSRDVAQEEDRVVLGKPYKMFYNPMWRLLANGATPGSYFYRRGELVEYHWHMFDQVLVRPALLPQFPEDRTELLAATSFGPLLAKGRPNGQISDHLPLKFHLGSDLVP